MKQRLLNGDKTFLFYWNALVNYVLVNVETNIYGILLLLEARSFVCLDIIKHAYFSKRVPTNSYRQFFEIWVSNIGVLSVSCYATCLCYIDSYVFFSLFWITYIDSYVGETWQFLRQNILSVVIKTEVCKDGRNNETWLAKLVNINHHYYMLLTRNQKNQLLPRGYGCRYLDVWLHKSFLKGTAIYLSDINFHFLLRTGTSTPQIEENLA